MKPSSTLNAAIFLWRSGQPIDVAHWMRLAEQGHDVAALEAKYLN